MLSAAPTQAASRTIAFVKAKYQSYDIFHRPADPVVLFIFQSKKHQKALLCRTPRGKQESNGHFFARLALIFYINVEKILKYF